METELLEYWSKFATEDADVVMELESLKATSDIAAVEDHFYRELEFGTGGLRGAIGAGSNRMNIYTVRKATQGLAQYMLKNGIIPKVAIAY
ncbi:MAG: phospho-sugar mutase, partial [Oscillospiraceae bacterium]